MAFFNQASIFEDYDRERAVDTCEGIAMQFTKSKGYLTVQATEEGYFYIFYDSDLHEIHSNDYDDPKVSVQNATYEILKNERRGGRGMSTSQCAVYQVKETPEYRDVRFRSYEKLRSEGKSVSIENYQQVYIGRIKPGETPADIKTRLQKQRPKNFKGHSIGCSDVLVVTDAGETTAYYINKDGFIIVPEFLTIKSSSDTRLSIDTTGYEIEGKKGTWLAQDYILMNEKKWFLMEHEEYGTRAAYVILSEDGAVVMNDCYNGFDEEARRNIQNFMQQQAVKEQEQQRQQQVQSQIQPNQIQQSPEQQKKKPELANWQKVMDNGEYLRSAEMAEEANYNMIDGLMNNTPKKKDKNAPRRSVLKRLRKHQQKIASQGKGQPQQQRAVEEEMERKKK